jgi:hypothetical protein
MHFFLEEALSNDNLLDEYKSVETGFEWLGRYKFNVVHEKTGKIVTDVDMPGIPIEKVRYTGTEDQNIWHYPRLYVDGSSWVWLYALHSLRDFVKDFHEKRRTDN